MSDRYTLTPELQALLDRIVAQHDKQPESMKRQLRAYANSPHD